MESNFILFKEIIAKLFSFFQNINFWIGMVFSYIFMFNFLTKLIVDLEKEEWEEQFKGQQNVNIANTIQVFAMLLILFILFTFMYFFVGIYPELVASKLEISRDSKMFTTMDFSILFLYVSVSQLLFVVTKKLIKKLRKRKEISKIPKLF